MPAAVSLIEENSLRITAHGFKVKVRLNWYRSLPLSCVEKVCLKVDGEEIAPGSIAFGINEHSYSLEDLGTKTGEYWFVQDSAVLTVTHPEKIARGMEHALEAEITLRAPYILVGPGKFLTMPTRYSTIQVAA